MKKIFLFVVALAFITGISSCSSDDGMRNSVLKVTIDGEEKTFNVIVNKLEGSNEEGDSWVEIEVTATINNDPTEMLVFGVDEGELGSHVIWYFGYENDGIEYYDDTGINYVVEINENGRLKGAFVGIIAGEDNEGNPVEVVFTNGTFDIFHY